MIAWVYGSAGSIGHKDSALAKEVGNGRGVLSYTFYSYYTPENMTTIFHSAGWICGDDQDWTWRMPLALKMHPTTIARVEWSKRYFLTLLRFLSSRVMTMEGKASPNKGTAKALARTTLAKTRAVQGLVAVPEVHVIELRRRQTQRAEAVGTRTVEWSKRWLVSGHWRQQWYPSAKEHRPIWIDEYDKGPEGLPLVVPKKTAYEVNR
jgi:hypothetical protein